MIIIGEKINGTRRQVALAIQSRDANFIRDLAVRQFENGGAYPGINACTLPERGPEGMAWSVEIVWEAALDATLCFDSANRHTGRHGQPDHQSGRAGTSRNHDSGRDAPGQGSVLNEFQPHSRPLK